MAEWHELAVWFGIIMPERLVRLWFPEELFECRVLTDNELEVYNVRK